MSIMADNKLKFWANISFFFQGNSASLWQMGRRSVIIVKSQDHPTDAGIPFTIRFKPDLDDIDHRTHHTIEFKKIKFNVYVLYNK